MALGPGNSPVAARAAEGAPLTYVGSETCASCHRDEAKLWAGSHHKLAMGHATETTVLGDFSDASFEHFGVRSRFFRRDGKFMVETDGPDGKPAEFEIRYTFGVYPLQQYLIEFPDGRLQALGIAWDSRPKDKGGQRWFHLYRNEEVGHDDVLHWTKLNQNWNFMCAECHSTGVHKNYDAAKDRFATTWAEISVGCETCHGQGSAHVAWARDHAGWKDSETDIDSKGLVVRFDERKSAAWTIDPDGKRQGRYPNHRQRDARFTAGDLAQGGRDLRALPRPTGNDRRGLGSRPMAVRHARRVAAFPRPLFRRRADGGRGLQLRLVQAEQDVRQGGHVQRLPRPAQLEAEAPGPTASACSAMPRTNMRSQPTVATQASIRRSAVPPATCRRGPTWWCTCATITACAFPGPTCRLRSARRTPATPATPAKSAQWAADAVRSWHGADRKGFQHYAEAFHEAWADQADAEKLLAAAASGRGTPGFARAGALSELQPYLSAANLDIARSSLADPDPMVRIGALDMLESAPPEEIWPIAAPLLGDPVRGVRVRAADLLAAVPSADQPAGDRTAFERAAAEFVAAQELNADRPEARLTLGSFYARRGEAAKAEAEYKAALKLAPQFAPAAVNLADLYRQTGRDGEGESALRAALALTPKDAGLHYALGLALIRLKRSGDALAELRRAAELAPDSAQNAYVYAIALNSAGRGDEALKTLADALARHPDNREILTALVQIDQQAGDLASALKYAERLAALAPNDQELQRFIEELRRAAKP